MIQREDGLDEAAFQAAVSDALARVQAANAATVATMDSATR